MLLVLAICPYFIDLGGSSIWDANEAFYVETPREMMEHGDYVTPTFNYEARLNKPVLSYWVVAAFYRVFGVSPGVQRLPIAIGAIVMIATAFFLAWAGSSDTDRRIESALWSAIGLAITPRLLMFARRIFIDVYISMFIGLTLLFFALAERYPERRRLFLVLMYVAVGLGVLTKGPIAMALPGLIFAVYLVMHRELRRVGSMMIPAGIVIVAAIVLPYCAALYSRHGWGPIASFIVGENLARYTDGVGVDATRPFWFYLPVLFSDSFPWSVFLIVAAAAGLRTRQNAAPVDDPARRARTLMWLWITLTVLFFTLSAAKQDLYIFPIVPAVAGLAGIVIARGPTDGLRWAIAAIGIVAVVAGAGVAYLVGSPEGIYLINGARLMGLTGVAGGAMVIGAAIARRTRAALVCTVLLFIALDWIFVLRVLPGFERYKPVPGFAATLAPRVHPDDLVITYNEALPSLVFYLQRHVDPYFLAGEFIEPFRSGRTVYAVLSADNYEEVKTQIGTPTCVLDRRPTFDVRLKNILAEQPLTELLLITNRCGN
jgi:4-amino-4-deoxy-L-arabinose transferase-like glycosyltransferase